MKSEADDGFFGKIKDPATLAAAVKEMGFNLIPIGAEKKEEKKEEGPKLPAIQLDPEKDFGENIPALNEFFNSMIQYMQGTVKQEVSSVKEMVNQSEKKSEGDKIKAFAKAHPKLKDVVDVVQPLYNSGMDLEQAYQLGLKAKGITETEGGEAKATSTKKTPVVSSTTKTDTSVSDDDLKDVAKNTREAASMAMDKLIADDPELAGKL